MLKALVAYQNADGGFGNGLEPDIRAPISQPQPVEVALRLLDELNAIEGQVVARACDYLHSIRTPEGGVPFVLPSVRDYPRAPWWESGEDPAASVNPTAAIAGLLHKHGADHPWLDPATAFCWRKIEARDGFERYDMVCVLTFLQHTPGRDRAEAAFERMGRAILEGGLVELNPAQAAEFSPRKLIGHPPSDCCRRARPSRCASMTSSAKSRRAKLSGVAAYVTSPSPLAELEWRGAVTVKALLTLRAYGRLA